MVSPPSLCLMWSEGFRMKTLRETLGLRVFTTLQDVVSSQIWRQKFPLSYNLLQSVPEQGSLNTTTVSSTWLHTGWNPQNDLDVDSPLLSSITLFLCQLQVSLISAALADQNPLIAGHALKGNATYFKDSQMFISWTWTGCFWRIRNVDREAKSLPSQCPKWDLILG